MDFVQRMKRALQRGRPDSLPPDPTAAAHVLLPYVVQNQHKIVVELLANSSYNVNYQFGRAQRTLLHSAANTDAIDSLAYLLKRGAVVNLQDKIGVTPLHLAARNGHKKCVQKLLEHGADISLHDNEGLTALHWLACNGRTELLVAILQRGVSVDVVDVHGHTALHVACQNGHYKCVIQLLDYNASINKPNNEGRTPLYFACRHGQLKCVELLLKKGANVTLDNNKESPVDVCVESGYKECVELLLVRYPEEVDRLIWLVKQENIPRDKIESVLEYLCKSGFSLMVSIISQLARLTATAGMELLSLSSSYQDLMPQFLRCVHVLCSLYPYYLSGVKQYQQNSNTALSMTTRAALSASCTTDLQVSGGTARHSSSRLGRVGSVDGGISRMHSGSAHSFLNTFGHRRAGSHGNSLEPFAGLEGDVQPTCSVSLGNLAPSPIPPDPLQEMEMVWTSLYSWFDLLMKEIQKLPEVGDEGNLEAGTTCTSSSKEEECLKAEGSSEVKINIPERAKDEPLTYVNGAAASPLDMAAAIILSAPAKRRQMFLRSSPSVDGESMLYLAESKILKRRSWHVERVCRVIALEEDCSSLPSLSRSISTEAYSERAHAGSQEQQQQLGEVVKTRTSSEELWNPDIVGAYADRLAAVTHAFSLCCSSLHKTSGRSGVLPRFMEFVNKYEAVLKVLLARNPKLVFAHFHFLLEGTELLMRFMHIVHAQPFEDRKKWFYENLYHGVAPSQSLSLAANNNEIIVDRESVFTTSCSKIVDASLNQLKEGLLIRFHGEAGMGSGVTREWFNELSREVLNPDYALFTQSADGATFQPNSHSDVNPDHLSYFKFAGRTMALAIYHQHLLNVYFTRSFYKHILGIAVSYKDVESIDPEYAKSLQWLLDNEIDPLDLGLTFSVETDVFGATELIQLKTGGSSITVTDANKREYVQLVTEMRMTQAIGPQIRSFQDGFYELVPHHLISLFDEYELELLMSGLPDIDVDDWKKNTEYSGYDESSDAVQWFWEVVGGFEMKDLAVLLQFVTGSSRVPLGGFSNLVGASGITKFTISQIEYTHNRLPTASTCFNLLKLPSYPTMSILKERLNFALTCGSGLIDIT